MLRIAGLMLSAFLILSGFIESQAQTEPGVGSLPTLPGRIAYIGQDYNVYVVDGASGMQIALTDDAALTADHARLYQWPTWATDGRLAYFSADITAAGQVTLNIHVSEDGAAEGEIIYSAEGETFTYAHWAPQNCSSDGRCRDLAVLLSRRGLDGLALEQVRNDLTGDEAEHFTLGTGAPYYFTWSPNAQQMIWQRNNERIDIFDISNRTITATFDQQPGATFVPQWSPVDDRLLFGILADSGQTNLVIANGQDVRPFVTDLVGPVNYAWSPDGNSIAYVDAAGPLIVLDAVSGEMRARTMSAGVRAFFWSPDSRYIAFITTTTEEGSFSAKRLAAAQTRSSLSWSVLEVESGNTRRFGSFRLTREMAYLLTYFDQFAPSHRVWSPDSRYIVYAEAFEDGRTAITIMDITVGAGVPLAIADGLIGIWSYN